MKWVTWENVGIDRIGCGWLIRKHIDPKAKFSFIPAGTSAIPDGAEPFDMPGVRLADTHFRSATITTDSTRDFGRCESLTMTR